MPDNEIDLQEAAGHIADAFTDHDVKALAALTPDERAVQAEIRWQLHQYISRIWDAPNEGPNGRHAVDVGGFEGVGAALDLLTVLWANAQEAQHQAGDDIDTVSVDVTIKREDDDDPDAL